MIGTEAAVLGLWLVAALPARAPLPARAEMLLEGLDLAEDPEAAFDELVVVTGREGGTEVLTERMRERLARDPDDALACATLARAYARLVDERAEGTANEAAAILDPMATPRTAITIELSLAELADDRGDARACAAAFERAWTLAIDLGDAEDVAEVGIHEAKTWAVRGERMDLAEAQLLAIDDVFGDGLSTRSRMYLSHSLGAVAEHSGRSELAAARFRRGGALAALNGDHGNAAKSEYNAILSDLDLGRPETFPSARVALRRVLVEAEARQLGELVARTRGVLAQVEAEPAREALLQACLDDPRVDPIGRQTCRTMLAQAWLTRDPEGALVLFDRTLADAIARDDAMGVEKVLRSRSEGHESVGDFAAALADQLVLVELAGRFETTQRDDVMRARLRAEWARSFHAAARLLWSRFGERPGASELAFELIEASRQRDREPTRLRLVDVPARAAALRRTIARDPGALLDPDRAVLRRARAELADDEALVVFALGRDDARAVVVTPEAVRVLELPPSVELASTIEAWVGMLASGISPDAAARRAYTLVLADASTHLPPRIRRLRIVPDGALHRLPWAALRDEAGRTLVERYRLDVHASVGAWLSSRDEPSAASDQVVVVADPWPVPPTPRLPTLRHAAREAEAIADALDHRVERWTGLGASSQRLRELPAPPAILHFATHARIDVAEPTRSAVLLAPDERGDPWLDASDIARLDLRGTVVVLAACSSADGLVLRGEGMLGLARSFFDAGAKTVVGTLWAVSDAEAASFFAELHERLGAGASVGEAVAQTQRAWARRGWPARTWAAIAVLGDGDVRPMPDPVWPTATDLRTLLRL